ncbi:MAG: sigma 54-interacting transcriptional regulator [Deltaproteobacteria bacterium]|nr:sigma 54-interacting transcriptional regulator [Deltaproteobacteria bacterium]
MAHIVVKEPGRVTTAVPVHEGFRVGRHEGNDLVLRDRHVSRDHAQFGRVATGAEALRIVDLESTHGVFVNGERIEVARDLGDGDRIEIGSTVIEFYAADEPPVEVVQAPAETVALETGGQVLQPFDDAAFAEHDESNDAVHRAKTAVDLDRRDAVLAKRLRVFYEVSRAIGNLGDSEKLLSEMLGAILEVLECDRGVVGLVDNGQGELRTGPRRIVRVRGAKGAAADEEIVVSRSLLEAMVVRREALIVPDLSKRQTPHTMVQFNILSAMGAPLQTKNRLYGFVYVDTRGRKDHFTRDDLDFLTALSYLTAAALESAEEYQRVSAAVEALRDVSGLDPMVGASAALARLKSLIQRYARADGAHVLVRGESGSGKELVARTLHALSPRSEQPFVALNCAAIPDQMIESELFGHERGAFTGATKDRRGKFALAHRGTLFLDEIGDLSLTAQAKVLRAIEEGELQPLGSEKTVHVDVRIISATHKDLQKEVTAGRFREDLYYRLNVVELVVPPLRERADDVILLAERFLARRCDRMGKNLAGFTPGAALALKRYRWPGNVREVENEIERAAIVAEGMAVDVGDLSPKIATASAALSVAAPETAQGGAQTLAARFSELETTERFLVQEAMREARGNVSEAARILGITRIMMKRRLDRFAEPTTPDEQ